MALGKQSKIHRSSRTGITSEIYVTTFPCLRGLISFSNNNNNMEPLPAILLY